MPNGTIYPLKISTEQTSELILKIIQPDFKETQAVCLKASILVHSPDYLSQNCSCLPLCNSIKYNVKYYSNIFSESNETTINFKLNTEDIIVYKRYQQFSKFDVVSCVGGLLGLFAGISFLSIFEFFYFITLRFLVNIWRIARK